MTDDELCLWTIYRHPPDYPDHYVARKFILDGPTSFALFASTLDAIRAKLPPGLYPIPRAPSDPEFIVETWM
jgi:hypothetical protein